MSDEGPRHGHPLWWAPMCWECWQFKAYTAESQNQALQGALRWIAANEVDPLDANRVVQLQAMIDRARNALSPTQETDRCPTCGYKPGPGVGPTDLTCADPFHRPTQETDPE